MASLLKKKKQLKVKLSDFGTTEQSRFKEEKQKNEPTNQQSK